MRLPWRLSAWLDRHLWAVPALTQAERSMLLGDRIAEVAKLLPTLYGREDTFYTLDFEFSPYSDRKPWEPTDYPQPRAMRILLAFLGSGWLWLVLLSLCMGAFLAIALSFMFGPARDLF